MRQSATCAVELAASCPTLRSGSRVATPSLFLLAVERHLVFSRVVRRVFRCTFGDRKKVSSSSPPSLRLVTPPGQRLAHVRSKTGYARRAASALGGVDDAVEVVSDLGQRPC